MTLDMQQKRTTKAVRTDGGFTIVEISVVIFIILLLATAVTLILDPFELVDRSADQRRTGDIDTLQDMIEIARSEGGGAFDIDAAYTNSCVGESAQKVFVSVPSSETPPEDLPSGWSYQQVSQANLSNMDGTGWLPIDLADATAVGAQLSHLPVDPQNSFSSGQYYSFVCDRSGFGFELTARMASKRYRTNGNDDVQSSDGGDEMFAYEAGDNLGLHPKAPVLYWGLNGATSGSIANGETAGLEDSSGNDNNGQATTDGGLVWAPGRIGGAVDFDGVGDRVETPDSPTLDIVGNQISLVAWFNPTVDVDGMFGAGWPVLIAKRPWTVGGYMAHFYDNNDANDGLINMQYCWSGSCLAVNSTTRFTADNWYHYVGTLESDTQRVYIDGSQEGENPIVQTMTSSAGVVFQIAGDFNGIIDEVAIYDRTLTAEEVAYQYDALKP